MRFLTCQQCKKKFTHPPIILEGSTWYNLFEEDNFSFNPGVPPFRVTKEIMLRARSADRHSKVHGKIFNAFFPYCSQECICR